MSIRISLGEIDRTGRHGLRTFNQELKRNAGRTLMFDSVPGTRCHENMVAAGIALLGPDSNSLEYTGPISTAFKNILRESLGFEIKSPELSQPKCDYTRATLMRVDSSFQELGRTPGRDITRLVLLPSERFYGSLAGIKELLISTNANFVASEIGARALVAASFLFAPDLLAKEIELDANMSKEDLEFCRELARALRVELVVNGE